MHSVVVAAAAAATDDEDAIPAGSMPGRAGLFAQIIP